MPSRRAFALLPALTLSALCVGMALLCHSVASLSGSTAGAALGRERGRLDALASARLGIGMLAQVAGPDRRRTGNGEDGLAWAATRLEEGWRIELLSGMVKDGHGPPLVWSTRDLSCRCDVVAPLSAYERAAADLPRPRSRQVLASGATQPAPALARLSAARAGDEMALAGDIPAASLSSCTRSLLIDPASGQWRLNLSVPAELAKRMDAALATALLEPSAAVREQPARGLGPVEVGGGPVRLRHMPALTDLTLSFGVFNARSDGRHRVRLHAQMTLWNPSDLPLLTPADKRLFLAEVEGAPELTVTNLDSGASFTTWLDQCAPGVFWGYTQGVRERGLWWWVEVLDSTRHGMARSGLLPGEVYSLRMPDPSAQPYGLSRVVGRGTWRYDDAAHPPGWVRPSPEVFLPTDRIVVAMRFITPGVTVRLHPYVGPLDPATEAAAYASPALLSLAHIPWPDARVELTGADYSRADSNGYVIGERRFSWRISLAAATERDVRSLASDPVFMAGRSDLADPAERLRWQLTSEAAGAALLPADAAGPALFRDAWVNRHEALADQAFDDWRVREVPVDPPVDVAKLRALQGATPGWWMPDLDRAFFSCPQPLASSPRSENPRLVPWHPAQGSEAELLQRAVLCGPAAAEAFALEGAFNVHAMDPGAWEAFLRSDPVDWTADVGGPSAPGHIVGSTAFFTQSSGAMLAKFGSACPSDLGDEMLLVADTETRTRAARRQSVRAPKPEVLRRLCECLVAEIRQRAEPFEGVAEFYRSGILDRAIATAKLNEGIPEGSPLWLDGPAVLNAHAALLVARGDTFTVVGEGRAGGGRQHLELTVQRLPEVAALPHLGRRLAVVRARWLDGAAR